jgi:hypothetical protein
LTPQTAEVFAEQKGTPRARNGILFDSATLLSTREEAVGQVALVDHEHVDDPASFARRLRASNLFVEVWLWAMLAAPSLS